MPCGLMLDPRTINNNHMKTDEKLTLLRKQMKRGRVGALVIPTADPHLSEYIPDYWKAREWLSGFTGSAGTLVVTADRSALWVDSRYYIQAEQQIAGTEMELCKIGLPEVPTIENWLKINLKDGTTVGFDARLFSVKAARELIASLDKMGFAHNSGCNFIDEIWKKRPPLPGDSAYLHKLEFAKIPVQEKLGLIRKRILASGAKSYLMCALDEVCWTFNLRGSDIAYNPVVLSFGYIDEDRAVLFIDPAKLSDKVKKLYEGENVEVKDYRKLDKFLLKLGRKDVVAFDPAKTNYHIYKLIPPKTQAVEVVGFATEAKAHKSSAEVDGFKEAMVQDGAALVEFFCWLDKNLGKKNISEISLAEKLLSFRSKRPNFVCQSFAPIVAYKEHGAIVHYGATPQTDSPIAAEGFLLLDTGGQYYYGTTDITRTVHLGSPTAEEKFHYTLVLKGMINLARARFPYGTRGSQLDTFARQAMWANGLNYGHGTGHGVGLFLNVHEGPQQIRPDNHSAINPGMVMSDEPGIYIAGKYGIRIENLVVCKDWTTNEHGRFLEFETLTLCPIDTKPIDTDMLTSDEIEWLNSYHSMVNDKIAPLVSKDAKEWLAERTRAI